MRPTIPELLIPAGDLSKLRVAIAYGADAVYVGAAGFSMRPDVAAFTPDVLREATALTHQADKRIYVAVNSLMMGQDLEALRAWLMETRDIPFDAIILSDPGALRTVQETTPEREIHISTQLSTANPEAARFWADAGASRVILARECSLKDTSHIAAESRVPVEIFVHGAMCMAVSGRCLLSAHFTGMNASQGQCKHTCRWDWQLVEAKRPGMTLPVYQADKETVFLGSTDLCLIEHIPEVVQTGAVSVKVEGRMKGEYYVAVVTRTYRNALDAYAANPDAYQFDPAWMEELLTVTHQPYETGFAFGYPSQSPETLQTDQRLGGTYNVAGIVTGEESGLYTVDVKRPFALGQMIEWIGPGRTGGAIKVDSLTAMDGTELLKTHCGTTTHMRLADSSQSLPNLAILRIEASS